MSSDPMKKIPRAPSAASSSSAASATEQPHAHGLRSQFGQLLPRHALFEVHVDIEQLSNVPLMRGQFAVRWKFKNTQGRTGLLSKMKSSNSWSSRNKGKARASDLGLAIEVTPAEGGGEGEGEPDARDTGGESSPQTEGTEDEPHPFMDEHLLSPETAVPPTAVPPMAAPAPGSVQKSASGSSLESRSVARGATPWRELQSYNVKWEHHVNVLVQMDVHRETGDLLPNELKLVVMQRVIPGDPDSPRQPRLGAVYLNLAEYADAGQVTRRYLLRESRTNATLKLTIELEHMGGASHYRPPPLRKGEILASVTGLLSNNDLLQTSIARQVDEYTHQSLAPGQDGAQPAFLNGDGSINAARLAGSYGLRSTEELIETLFNPLASASADPSPFTYFAPVPTRSDSMDTASDAASVANSASAERQSMRSMSSDGVSVEKLAVDSVPNLAALDSPVDGHKTWWRKMRPSRPATPVTRQYKLPSPLPRHSDLVQA